MTEKELEALYNTNETVSVCLRDIRNVQYELAELLKDNSEDMPYIEIFPEQPLLKILNQSRDSARIIAGRLQATYFITLDAIKTEQEKQ